MIEDDAARSASAGTGINMLGEDEVARRTNVAAIGLAGPAVKASAVDMMASIDEDEKRGCAVVCWCLMAKRLTMALARLLMMQITKHRDYSPSAAYGKAPHTANRKSET